jgi:hypothetical protein
VPMKFKSMEVSRRWGKPVLFGRCSSPHLGCEPSSDADLACLSGIAVDMHLLQIGGEPLNHGVDHASLVRLPCVAVSKMQAMETR